jgi:hypothetical protein
MNAIRFQPLRGRMTFAVLGLGLNGLHGAVIAVLALTGSTFVLEGWIAWMLLLGGGLPFIAWLFDARTNLEGVEPRLRWHPIWSHTSWFIPVLCLVVPLFVVREIDGATQRLANGSDRTGLFAVWATSWTVFQIAWFVSGGLVMGVVEVVAATAAVLLVLRITALQQIAGSPRLVA